MNSIPYQAGWYFYALGPQLICCLALGWLTARRTGGSLLNWLVVGFLTSIVPVLGVLVMAGLFVWATRRAASSSLT
jgi:hypothetical protein